MSGGQVLLFLFWFLALAAFIFQKRAGKYFAIYYRRLLALGVIIYVFGLLGIVAYCLYFGFLELKASLAIKDTVTSRISSAAQGYVEIIGKGLSGQSLSAPLSGLPCLWYEYSEYQNKSIWPNWFAGSKDWKLVSSGKFHEPFVISDGTAACQVDPKGALMSNLDHDIWYDGKRRFHELLLLANKDIYVLGNFVTMGEEHAKAKVNKEVSALINEWKQTPEVMKAAFDLDNDGEISMQEMALVRARAQRGVKEKTEVKVEAVNTIGKPKDKRPFVISHHPHSKLVRRHRLHGLFYLLICLILLPQVEAYCTGIVFNSRLCQKLTQR